MDGAGENLGTSGAAGVARTLLAEMAPVVAAIRAEAEAREARWAPGIGRAGFAESAANLAAYLALRHADLRPFQTRLAALGLSSLGRAEAHVAASVEAVLGALSAIAGAAGAVFPDPARFAEGPRMLAARRDRIFGPGMTPGSPETRIMATLPSDAADNPAFVARLVAEGVDCVRINCAHDAPEDWAAMIAHAKAAGRAAGREIAVAMDLAGPKIRTVAVSEKVRLMAGERFAIAADAGKVTGMAAVSISHPELAAMMHPGVTVWFDDGKLRARVVECTEAGAVVLEVTGARAKGVKLKPGKGVNLPGADLAIPALTDHDRACLGFVARNADIVGLSFVQTVADIDTVVDALDAETRGGARPALMLKIETPMAVRNLPELVVRAGGAAEVAVMIARGDLAVEIGFERLSEIQEEILWLCEAASVPVVWATEVLDGLLHEGQASRAETTDAAMGQRAECVMLNKGPYLPEALAFLRGILMRMDRHQKKKFAWLGPLGAWRDPG
ncbi:MAG: pyruvate kinase [Rhodobacteraceae bacterium]|uniref:pyruvate kinase n=1 Tax=Albidovulum sp. TaxID=1872424 RepID=UPI001DA1B0A8|nr:pyruvate kinase [uncultured Defluviimonas sp.]MCB2125699.1 pyruvate kinase [Paracoccaceae bacterium]MCC0069068.1 pyruvate kinase [Paracoccaceae bacterium]